MCKVKVLIVLLQSQVIVGDQISFDLLNPMSNYEHISHICSPEREVVQSESFICSMSKGRGGEKCAMSSKLLWNSAVKNKRQVDDNMKQVQISWRQCPLKVGH